MASKCPLRFRHRAWIRSPLLPCNSLPSCSRTSDSLPPGKWAVPPPSVPLPPDTSLWAIHTSIPTELHPFIAVFFCLAVSPSLLVWKLLPNTFQGPAQISNFGETIYSIPVSGSLLTLLYCVNFQTGSHLSVSLTGSCWEQGLNASRLNPWLQLKPGI